MNCKEITYNTYESGEIKETKTLRLRLTSGNVRTLEKEIGKSVLEYIEEQTVPTATTILRFARMFEDRTITINQAEQIYDELIDDGYTLKKVFYLLYETLVVSGFLEKSEWEEMKATSEDVLKKLKEEQKKALQNI